MPAPKAVSPAATTAIGEAAKSASPAPSAPNAAESPIHAKPAALSAKSPAATPPSTLLAHGGIDAIASASISKLEMAAARAGVSRSVFEIRSHELMAASHFPYGCSLYSLSP